MTFPNSVSVKDIDVKHPELAANTKLYDDLTILYTGGSLLRQNISRFLVRHTKEIGGAYLSRMGKVTYDNLLSVIVSFFTAKLFESPLEIQFTDKESKTVDEFYAAFLEDCDRSKTSINRFFEQVAIDMLVYGKAYYLTDLPKLATVPNSLQEQKALGGLNPYLCHLDINSVENWSKDEYGNFDWVLVHSCNDVQKFLQPTQTVETWTYYDKNNFAKYQVTYEQNKQKPTTASLVDQGPHAMSALNQVPVACVDAGDKLFLGNRVILPLIEYLNHSNSFSYSLWLANNPLPVLTDGDVPVDSSQTVSEYAFLKLPKGATFAWAEPAGTSWTASQNYLESLRTEIFRSCHVVALARSNSRTANSASAVSKMQDMLPSSTVLNTFALIIKQTIQNTLDDIAKIRSESVISDIRGMTMIDDSASQTIEEVISIRSIGVPSPTYARESLKKLVRATMRDANAAKIQEVTDEIDAASDIEVMGIPVEPTTQLSITEQTQQQQ